MLANVVPYSQLIGKELHMLVIIGEISGPLGNIVSDYSHIVLESLVIQSATLQVAYSFSVFDKSHHGDEHQRFTMGFQVQFVG